MGTGPLTAVTIKEGVAYSVGITFEWGGVLEGADDRVENEIVSGLRFLQVVKRAGLTGGERSRLFLTPVDKTEAMLGSVGRVLPSDRSTGRRTGHTPRLCVCVRGRD